MRVMVAVLAPVVAGDLRVRASLLEQPHDVPALGQVMQLAERAQVAEEPLGRGAVGQRQDRVEEVVGGGTAPLGGFGAHVCSGGRGLGWSRSWAMRCSWTMLP